MSEEEFKLKGFESFIYEFVGWSCFVMFFAGIWWNDYRWKLIITSIFLFGFIMLSYHAKSYAWKKRQEKIKDDEFNKFINKIGKQQKTSMKNYY